MQVRGSFNYLPDVQITGFLELLQSNSEVVFHDILSFALEHCQTDHIHIPVTIFVSEDVVPQCDSVEQLELLRKE